MGQLSAKFMRVPVVLGLLLAFVVSVGCVPTIRQTPQPSATTSPAPGASPSALPGRQADGSVLLPNQWSLRPAGRQIELGDFPVNIAVHPGGRFAAILHSGYSSNQVSIVDVRSGEVISRAGVAQSFYGLEFS